MAAAQPIVDSFLQHKIEELAKTAVALQELRYLAAECCDAVEAWDSELSSYCDGPERDEVRASVVELRKAINGPKKRP